MDIPVINGRPVIYFEGNDGVGKSTIVEKVSEILKENGYSVTTISQPRSCKIGEVIYGLHHQYRDLPLYGFARQLLHVACHIQSYHEMEHDASQIIISDRSFVSSMAYGYAYPQSPETREFEVRAIFDLETYMIPRRLRPTHIFYFSNPSHEKVDEVWENNKKVAEGYQYVLGCDYFKQYLKSGIQCYAVQNKKGDLDRTIQTVLELIGK